MASTYEVYKSRFKATVCKYFEDEGCPREKLAECLQGVTKVAGGTPVGRLFSERHHGRVRCFALQWQDIQKLQKPAKPHKRIKSESEQRLDYEDALIFGAAR